MHHSYPEAYANQIIVDDANDRLVLRVQGEELECGNSLWGGPSWWVYRLSDGQLVERFDPRERDPEVDNPWWMVDAVLISGTPLILTHWYTSGPNYKPERREGNGFGGQSQAQAACTLKPLDFLRGVARMVGTWHLRGPGAAVGAEARAGTMLIPAVV